MVWLEGCRLFTDGPSDAGGNAKEAADQQAGAGAADSARDSKGGAGLATITLSLTETPVKQADKDDEDPDFVDALAGGWNAFVTMFRWIAIALGTLLPFLVGAALLVLLWVRLVRPRLPRRPATASASAASTTACSPTWPCACAATRTSGPGATVWRSSTWSRAASGTSRWARTPTGTVRSSARTPAADTPRSPASSVRR